MGVTVAVTRAAAETDAPPNTQDFTTADLGGLTPKAALFIATYGVTDGTQADHWVRSYGACDASREWCLCFTMEDNVGTGASSMSTDDDLVIRFNDPGTATVDGSAEFDSFIANGS